MIKYVKCQTFRHQAKGSNSALDRIQNLRMVFRSFTETTPKEKVSNFALNRTRNTIIVFSTYYVSALRPCDVTTQHVMFQNIQDDVFKYCSKVKVSSPSSWWQLSWHQFQCYKALHFNSVQAKCKAMMLVYIKSHQLIYELIN